MKKEKTKLLVFPLLLVAMVFLFGSLSMAAQSIAVQGRLLNADGSVVTSSAVQFTVKVKSPGVEDCLLYQETQTLDLSQTAGSFALTLGSGTRAPATVDGGNTLNAVFSNSSAISLTTAPAACANAATSFTPGTSDTRNLEITFNDGSGSDSIPTIPLAWTPQSIYSQDSGKLAGVSGPQFLKVATGTTPATLSAGEYSNLAALLNGSSTQYMSSSTTTGTVVPNLSSAPATPSSGQMWFDSVSNTMKYYNGSATQTIGTSSGLSSVGLSMPGIFSVAGSPLTANGSITTTLANQTASTVFAGPSSGGAVAPTFRTLAATDLPIAVAGGIIKDGGNSLGAAMTVGTNDANTLELKTNNSTRMTVLSGGNVGIGISSPSQLLHLSTTSAASQLLFDHTTAATPSVAQSSPSILVSGRAWNSAMGSRSQSGGMQLIPIANNANPTAAKLSFLVGVDGGTATEQMSISSLGNFQVGNKVTATQDISGGSISFTGYFNGTSTITTFGTIAALKEDSVNGNDGGYLAFSTNVNGGPVVTEKMRITNGGNVGVGITGPSTKLHVVGSSGATIATFADGGATTCTVTPASTGFACSSDERLKKNIETFSDSTSLENILQLRTVTYDWRGIENGRHTGYIAQELEKVAPEIVRTGEDGFKQVNYTGLVPWITGAIKALYAEFKSSDEVKAREIASVSSKANKLEAQNAAIMQENAELKARLDQQEKELAVIKNELGL
tara:strand:+ start:36188 stop:38374 length:2187 start_codon:yes stop_codon:yes gene_type:complete